MTLDSCRLRPSHGRTKYSLHSIFIYNLPCHKRITDILYLRGLYVLDRNDNRGMGWVAGGIAHLISEHPAFRKKPMETMINLGAPKKARCNSLRLVNGYKC